MHDAFMVEGGTAASHARLKRSRAAGLIPHHAFFLPIALESEGYICDDYKLLLKGWATRWAEVKGHSPLMANKLYHSWLDQVAMMHARMFARCLIGKAAGCMSEDALRGSSRYLAPTVGDVISYSVTGPTGAGRGGG